MSNYQTQIWNKIILDDVDKYKHVARTGINMRDELHAVLYGTQGSQIYGHWIVYRAMDKTKLSKYWNNKTGEAIGGPKYEYKDYIIRTRRYAWDLNFATNKGLEIQVASSIATPGDFIYYFEYIEGITVDNNGNITINEEDCLYELRCPDITDITQITYKDYMYKLEFIRVEPIYDRYGRIEYFMVVARRSAGGSW